MQFTIEKPDKNTRIITITVPASEKEEDLNEMVGKTCTEAIDSMEEEVVSTPEIRVLQNEDGKDFIYSATVATRPDVTLGTYKEIKVVRPSFEITDKDLEAAIAEKKRRQTTYVPISEDRPVKTGDQVDLDFEGFCDGVPFEGGKGEHYPLVIGSGSFIPGFEDQLIGARVNEDIDVNVTFPEAYTPSLAGKDAVFKCKIHEIREKKELPVNEEEVRKELEMQKEQLADETVERAILDQIIANTLVDIPEPMIRTMMKQVIDEFDQTLQQQGMNLDMYCQMVGTTMDNIRKDMEQAAIKRIMTRLVLEEIALQEAITATEEEWENELKVIASSYGTDVETIRKIFTEQYYDMLMQDIKVQKALDFVKKSAIVEDEM